MKNQFGMILSNLVYLKKYDHATGEKADCGVLKVSTKAFVILTGTSIYNRTIKSRYWNVSVRD